MEIILASHNLGKIAEFQSLIRDLPIEFVLASDEELLPPAETGLTFVENALIKARYAAEATGLPALADDSGLCVDALDDIPGVLTARYGGEHLTTEERNAYLLEALKDVPSEDRMASYHSVITLMSCPDDPAPLICHGIWEGEILLAPRGTNGFGYDPIFYVPTHHLSAAEMSQSEKNKVSHRGQAMHQFHEIMQEVYADVE